MKLQLPSLSSIKQWIQNHPLLTSAIAWTKVNSLPGLDGVPVYDVVDFILCELKRDSIFIRSNAVAFSFFLAIFPSLMAFFTLMPYVKQYLFQFLPDRGDNFHLILQQEIQEFLPGNVGLELSKFIDELITEPRVGLLSFGFILALFFGSNGMLMLMQSFEKSYEYTFRMRKGLKKRLVAIALTMQLGLLLIASVILIITGNVLLHEVSSWLNLTSGTQLLISILRWLVIIALFYFVIGLIYRYGVAAWKRFPLFSLGTTVATVGCIMSSLLFALYVDNFSNYNQLYGSFGTVIVAMLWIQIICLMLLIGFEINASIAVNRDLKARPVDKEDEDI